MLVGRIKEQKGLKNAYESPESHFVAVYGRRRIGKTYLVRETFGDHFAFYHTGVAKVGMADQLLNFRDSLVKYGYAECPLLHSWREAFLALEKVVERSSEAKKVLFLDELPWMDTPKSKFVSALEHFWNGWASVRKDIVLIVCGSATSWMIKKVIRDHGGLHNRVTNRICLMPFTLFECERYCEGAGLEFSREEICLGYMAFGGVPFYWSLLDRDLSMSQNVDALYFAPTGKLRGEYDELFSSVFKTGKLHRQIVEILARPGYGQTREDVLRRLGQGEGGKVSTCLEELEQCGFVRRYSPFGKSKKGCLFQLVDSLLLFHLQFVAGESNPDPQYWTNSVVSVSQSVWRGLAFERVCLLHVRQIRRALQIGGVVTHVCSWRHVPDEVHAKGAQIDLLLDRADGVIDVCEMKYAKDEYEPTLKSDEELRSRIAVFESVNETRKNVRPVLVTTYGLMRNKYSGRFRGVVTLSDLFDD